MLIVYRTATGEVIDNTGTNSGLPLGPPDEVAYANAERRGIPREELSLLRIDDRAEPALVESILAQRHHVDTATGEVVLDGPYPLRDLTADRLAIAADGVEEAVVTYADTTDTPPASVVFTVNGATTTVAVDAGSAELAVTATVAGPVTVTVDVLPDVEVVIDAQEVA